MRPWLLLLLPLLGCGGGWRPSPRSADLPRPAPGGVQQTPFACAYANNTGRWAWDCEERCLPAIEVRPLLCHGNGEVHLWVPQGAADPPPVFATLEPAELSGCGVPAYRIWQRSLDLQLASTDPQAGPAYKDRVCFSTWYTETTHCQDAAVVPKEQQSAQFFETHPGRAFHLMPDNEIRGLSE